jgi:hypothetical protein
LQAHPPRKRDQVARERVAVASLHRLHPAGQIAGPGEPLIQFSRFSGNGVARPVV